MTWPGDTLDFVIIFLADIFISDDGMNGSAVGISVRDTALKERDIRFLSGGGPFISARHAPIQKDCSFSVSTKSPTGIPSNVMPISGSCEAP